MLSAQIDEIRGRIERTDIGLKDALSIIDMVFDDSKPHSPHEAFKGLTRLIDRTVHGVRIERFKPRGNRQPFHTLEIHTEEGDILGHLNMIYMKRAIPCYYLVYVDVTDRFRGLGLGNRILRTFMEFVESRRAVGLLDNIIPPEEVTYEIYTRLGWKKIKDFFGDAVSNGWGNYMVFIPDSVQAPDLKDRLIRFLFSLNKKRPVIDMHDNEDMVKRTIEEFRSIYLALEELYKTEISSKVSTPLMRFMFTRLTTKLIGFRRRIAGLIGYTGGESLDQVHFSGGVKRLRIQPYSLWGAEKNHDGIWGDKALLAALPVRLRSRPTFFIENLPLYRRPYLRDRMERAGGRSSCRLKISDLLDLGLDPTRLREFHHQGVDYVFERVSPHFFHVLGRKRRLLKEVEEKGSGSKFRGAVLRINPPILVFRDLGNIYVLRKKVEGIHSEEAFDQLKTSRRLREMNLAAGVDRAMAGTIHDVRKWLEAKFKPRFRQEIEDLTYFLPWDIEANLPRVQVEVSGVSLHEIWIA